MAASLLIGSQATSHWPISNYPRAQQERLLSYPDMSQRPMAPPHAPVDADNAEPSRKPQLPNFSNFLSGVGQHGLDLAQPLSRPQLSPPIHLPLSEPSQIYASKPLVFPADSRDDQQSRPQGPSPIHGYAQLSEDGVAYNFQRRPSYSTTKSSPLVPETYRVPHGVITSLDPAMPTERARSRTVVREDAIPGKGICYVYDDGTICQKSINGNAVNPKWGTTKAGKPRKRLGQACNTCREKKIKCDPSFPKCTQCQKFGRECKFDTA